MAEEGRRTMSNELSTAILIERAKYRDEPAWESILRTYTPLLRAICRRYRIGHADTDDVIGTVWLNLVRFVHTIREPDALPGWLATTTHRECLNLLRNRRHLMLSDEE